MKIAIFFCGSIRSFPTCYPSIKRYLLNNLNADIFLHLWKMSNVSNLETNIDFKWQNDLCNENYVIDKLKPVKYIIDEYSDKWEKEILTECKIDITKLININEKNYGINACGMYYKIFKAFELVEEYSKINNIQYDIIIRARLDFIWEDNIFITDFINNNDNNIFLIRDRYATKAKVNSNDKFFAGNMTVMKKMCNLFNEIHNYQKAGIQIEGQTLNEYHINKNNLKINWIGHLYTYYKCMGRHIINSNGQFIIINNNNILEKLWYDLAYYLLYNNYIVIYLNKIDNLEYLDILSGFSNFRKLDNLNNLNVKKKIKCYIGTEVNNNYKNINQIIINPNNIIHNKIYTYISFNEKINNIELIDYIYSIILTKKYGGINNFNDKLIIYEIDIDEKVIYKYLDHGYYIGTINSYNKNNYLISFSNKQINTTRDTFKIFDIIKYQKNNNIMPVNLINSNYSSKK